MSKKYKLLKIAKDLNISILTIVKYLSKYGYNIEPNPVITINEELYNIVLKESNINHTKIKINTIENNKLQNNNSPYSQNISLPKIIGKIELSPKIKSFYKNDSNSNKLNINNYDKKSFSKKDFIKNNDGDKIKKKYSKLNKNISYNNIDKKSNKKKDTNNITTKKIKYKLNNTFISNKYVIKSKQKKNKKNDKLKSNNKNLIIQKNKPNILEIIEFITVNELSIMMAISVNDVIKACIEFGIITSINQRLDKDTISIITEYFGFEVKFINSDNDFNIYYDITKDDINDLIFRHPIVTVMGHVDHGKTSLLDYIRNSNITSSEYGGITQHIGAYEVNVTTKSKITFLDTPGHEAFTAMRARGATVTDIAIIIIAANSEVMPQTIEAINHAKAACIPIVFAISKIDITDNNVNKIKEQLSKIDILVEDWGGQYQLQEISIKTGYGIKNLLEKVLLEAEVLELKTNPNKNACGIVIESTLKKGLGIITTVIVQYGVIKVNKYILAGQYSGRIKAIFNENNKKITCAYASMPIQILGLQGAPNVGDKFIIMDSEQKAKDIAIKRQQLNREYILRTKKHITLDEIGRRLAIGNFKELNFIIKCDVAGSVEVLADSLIKLSNNQIKINIIHQSVGQISESDILLASASNAIIVGFQVRPSIKAKKISEFNTVEIRLYDVIYKAIEDVKLAIKGLLTPKKFEKITGNLSIKEIFKIKKTGLIIGCIISNGIIHRNDKVRVIRDGIVIHTGTISSLKQFKENVQSVSVGHECGIKIDNFNDPKIGDIIESFKITN